MATDKGYANYPIYGAVLIIIILLMIAGLMANDPSITADSRFAGLLTYIPLLMIFGVAILVYLMIEKMSKKPRGR